MKILREVNYIERNSCLLHCKVDSNAPLSLIEVVFDGNTKRNYEIKSCSICGSGLTSPYPDEETISILYESQDEEFNFDPIRNTIFDKLKDYFARCDLSWIIKQSNDNFRPTQVLDYGTGNGRFAIVASNFFAGCKVDAVDFSSSPPPSLKQNQENIRYLQLNDFKSNDLLYDLIILRHLLEHVHEPILFLASLANRLSKGGVIYIEVPNFNSAYIKIFGKKFNTYSAPYHLVHFTKDSLTKTILDAGLDVKIIQGKEMPLMGGILASYLKQPRTIFHQLVGALLQPVQILFGLMWGKPCLAAVVSIKN